MFNPMAYLPAPRFGAADGISLTQEIIAAAPTNPTEALQRWLADMKTRSAFLQGGVVVRQKIEPSKARPADLVLDASVRALYIRLDGPAQLPTDLCPEADRARELLTALFPNGLSLLKETYDKEWALVEVMLRNIDEKGLAAEIDAIAGPAYLAAVRSAHAAYGEVLGKKNPLAKETVNLHEGLKSLADAITGYTICVLGTADPARPETLEAVRQALKPILDYKADWSKSIASSAKPNDEANGEPGSEPQG